ncbi:MAG: 2-alkenal reductase [Alcanivorax borkumensis]|uniref:Serine endopeptidases n=1 Tax=Alcanivorax borkumensis (strain ATCC 700651 / DSM 11573 / NCIMB 13689 / SK2) TaxID=393595 RepID=Q0VS35_ALCBS|nr:2-alkenal reductase [Alcanivorax sp. 97CO-5]OJH07998.1 MAG: 2-alkenal reductase [Alcanivorax borkumensis]PKG01880.1 2-alkenal reductase [Alcanivorax sp. 97CO-6]BAP13433.1 serine endopeptidase [Alcanivorax sp. NBRC 101098]CAL16013.1 serine endopeptidases [Alcanivorax borkumensis SK2]
MIKLLRFLAGPVLTGLAVGLVALWWYQWGPNAAPAQHDTGVASYAGAVNHAAPAVVNIYTTQIITNEEVAKDPLFNRFMEQPRRERALSSLGSGVIVDDSGYVLTSYHVIRDADEILVALRDGRDAPARVVGTDSETDLALLHIALENLPEVELNGNGPVQVGDVVLAIGNPLGVGQTVSMGIVSATGRSHLGIATFENFIQTDAAINRGNSGGALIDTRGHLIGINTAILSADGSWQGIGFATPASIAREVMDDLIDHGRVIRGYLGVTVQDMTPSLAESFGVEDVRGGVVTEVVVDSPAHKGGLQPGDVLVGINGDIMADGYEAMNRIAGMKPDDKVTLEVIRNRQPVSVDVVIGTRPPAETD